MKGDNVVGSLVGVVVGTLAAYYGLVKLLLHLVERENHVSKSTTQPNHLEPEYNELKPGFVARVVEERKQASRTDIGVQ